MVGLPYDCSKKLLQKLECINRGKNLESSLGDQAEGNKHMETSGGNQAEGKKAEGGSSEAMGPPTKQLMVYGRALTCSRDRSARSCPSVAWPRYEPGTAPSGRQRAGLGPGTACRLIALHLSTFRSRHIGAPDSEPADPYSKPPYFDPFGRWCTLKRRRSPRAPQCTECPVSPHGHFRSSTAPSGRAS